MCYSESALIGWKGYVVGDDKTVFRVFLLGESSIIGRYEEGSEESLLR